MSEDTIPFITMEYYVKEFSNPVDTITGSSWGYFHPNDTTKLYSFINEIATVSIDDDSETISIDSLKPDSNRLFRTPFFNHTKSIIKYTLTTNDSLLTEFHDFGDSLLFQLTIYSDRRFVFSGKPVYTGNPVDTGYVIMKYDIWIDKTTGLPYKYKRGTAEIEECKDIQINKMDIKDFIPSRYFPAHYDIVVSGQGTITRQEVNLTGTTAPDWTLSDYNNETFSLKDFTNKVLLIQFSGIGCGYCQAAIPFLNQLVTDYKDKSFELVRIESWSDNADAIKNYCLNNNITYKFLLPDKEVNKKYIPSGFVPVFFILDENRTIQKVIQGFPTETTAKEIREKEIREAIEKLL